MLTDTLHRVPRADGRQLLVKRGADGSRELTAWRLHLPAGATDDYVAPKEETIVVLQDGRGTFAAGDHSWTVGRSGVFSDRATALYLPPNTPISKRSSCRPKQRKAVSRRSFDRKMSASTRAGEATTRATCTTSSSPIRTRVV